MPRCEKVKSLDELTGLLARVRAEKRRIVHTHGVFEILHPGAIHHFRAAREQGDLLVVTIAPQGEGARVMFSQQERAEAIATLECVEHVALANAGAVQTIQMLRPDVYVPWEGDAREKGGGQLSGAEADLVAALGCRIAAPASNSRKYPAFVHLSSPAFPVEAEGFLVSFASRYTSEHLFNLLDRCRGLRVLFLGETIIDEYQYCETIGKSGKEPILAARYLSAEKFPGGILATANQCAPYCDHVSLLSVLGTRDSHEEFIRSRLDPQIDASFVYAPDAPTILKRRFIEIYPFQKMFEVYVMEPVVPETVSRAVLHRLGQLQARFDLVVVSDYGHGMITPEIVELLCASSPFLAVNTQTNAANQGFNTVSKYRRADYICLSEKELRLEARNRTRDAHLLMAETAERLSCKRMLITRGREGCLCYDAREGFFPIPPFTNRIVDRVGAGDALLAVTAPCAAQEIPMEVVGFLGNAVGAQAVETVGNRSVVSRDALMRHVDSLLHFNQWFSAQWQH
jgi:bifunctional ADP-heptose synthase (sugar kinase/adenylyltransferase)